MNVKERIQGVRESLDKAPKAFREQIERARSASDKMDGQVPAVRGIDRSGELTPLPRPTIVRTLAEPE